MGALRRRNSTALHRQKLHRKSAAVFCPVDPEGGGPIQTGLSFGGLRSRDSRATRISGPRSCTRARRSCWNDNHDRSAQRWRRLVASFGCVQRSSAIRRPVGSSSRGAQIGCREKQRSGRRRSISRLEAFFSCLLSLPSTFTPSKLPLVLSSIFKPSLRRSRKGRWSKGPRLPSQRRHCDSHTNRKISRGPWFRARLLCQQNPNVVVFFVGGNDVSFAITIQISNRDA